MRRAACSGLFVWCFVGCAAAPDDNPTVTALRFRQLISEGAMDLSHGGGAWHDCLYFADAGVVAQVVWELPPAWWDTKDAAERPRLHAYKTARAPEPATWPEDAKDQPPPVPVQVPRQFAEQVIALAEREEQRRRDGERLGAECVATGAVRGRESVTGRGR